MDKSELQIENNQLKKELADCYEIIKGLNQVIAGLNKTLQHDNISLSGHAFTIKRHNKPEIVKYFPKP